MGPGRPRTLDRVSPPLVPASVGGFFDAVGQFFAHLAAVSWPSLILGLAFFGLSLTLRSRGYFNTLRAAYPDQRIAWRRIWAAYVSGFGISSVIPAKAGNVAKLFLTKSSVRDSSYSTVAASFVVEPIFETSVGVLILIYAFTQGVFPKPPDFSKLGAFDLSYWASHPRFALFMLTVLAVVFLVAFALLSTRVKSFIARVRQGVTVLRDRPRYLREVAAWQLAGWVLKLVAFWLLLDAFGVGGSLRNVLLVLGVNAVSSFVPFTPGGAGVQQALLVKVFAGTASGATVAAYSVGQQIALAAFSFGLALIALATVFRLRSVKDLLRQARAEQAAELAAR